MAHPIYSKVAGVTFANDDGSSRQALIRRHVRAGAKLLAIREPRNPRDRNAVGLWVRTWLGRRQIGYIRSELAADLAGQPLRAVVTQVTGGGPGKAYGVNILLQVGRGPLGCLWSLLKAVVLFVLLLIGLSIAITLVAALMRSHGRP